MTLWHIWLSYDSIWEDEPSALMLWLFWEVGHQCSEASRELFNKTTLHTMCYIRGRSLCRICCMAPMVSVLSSLVCRLHFQVLQLLDGISLMTRLCITIFSPYRIPGYSIAFTPVNGCDLGYNCATTSSQPLYFSLGFLWKYSVLKESATINNRKTKCLA